MLAGVLDHLCEVLHQARVAAFVALWTITVWQGDGRASSGGEIEQLDFTFGIAGDAVDFSLCAHELNCAIDIIGEGAHGKNGSDAISELQGYYLVIYYIVVAVIDAASVWAFLQGFEQACCADVVTDHRDGPALCACQIPSGGVVRARMRGGAAIQAPCRRALWRIRCCKMG